MPTKMTLKFSALSLEVVSDDTEFSLLIQGVGVVSGTRCERSILVRGQSGLFRIVEVV